MYICKHSFIKKEIYIQAYKEDTSIQVTFVIYMTRYLYTKCSLLWDGMDLGVGCGVVGCGGEGRYFFCFLICRSIFLKKSSYIITITSSPPPLLLFLFCPALCSPSLMTSYRSLLPAADNNPHIDRTEPYHHEHQVSC